MTPQEFSVLENMLQRLAAVHGVQKDPQADALIRERLSVQPDALYLLVQRTLLLEHALDDARRQLAQRAPATPVDPGGAAFLQRGLEPGFGRDAVDRDAYTPGRPAQPDARTMAPVAPPAPGWRERLIGGAAPAAPAPASGGGGSSFLGQAATAAAGVAGGMFLFNGIEHLMKGGQGGIGGGGGGSFLGLGGGGAGGGTPEVVENVTQNFYGDGARNNDGGNGDVGRLADDAGADWSGFDDGTSFDDDRFV